MYICNYCNCVLKHEYETCPNCGGSSFKTKAYLGETIIKEPPKGGYKIDTSNYKHKIKNANIVIFVGIVSTLFPFLSALPFLLLDITEMLLFFPFEMILGIIVLIIGIKIKKDAKKNMQRVINLSKEGMLVKAMPYELINTGTYVAGKYYKCIMVKFKNSAGVEIPLYSETKFNTNNDDDTVDLLIDPNDYSNYFIDYEIY